MDVGDRTTLAVMLALRELGYAISVPFGENTRYDLVIDDGTRLHRVQCKTGRLTNGCVEFRTSSSYAHHPNPKPTQRHYRGQVDCFAVFCRQIGEIYLIPIDGLPDDRALLRLTPPLNNQRKRIRLAGDYRIASVELPQLTIKPRPRASSGARGSSA
jgi:PD-(D/E)XK endonuclease